MKKVSRHFGVISSPTYASARTIVHITDFDYDFNELDNDKFSILMTSSADQCILHVCQRCNDALSSYSQVMTEYDAATSIGRFTYDPSVYGPVTISEPALEKAFHSVNDRMLGSLKAHNKRTN